MSTSEIDKETPQSPYYPFAPLHRKRKIHNVVQRYHDSVDALFGKYSSNKKLEQWGIIDYLTPGLFSFFMNGTTFKYLTMLKKGIARILAVPLMILMILLVPFIEVVIAIATQLT